MVDFTIDVSSMLISDFMIIFHYSHLPPERMVLVATNEFIIGLKLPFYMRIESNVIISLSL